MDRSDRLGEDAELTDRVAANVATQDAPKEMKDVLIDDMYKDQIEVIAVDTLDEVMENALVSNENKSSLVERLGAVIDRLTPNPSGHPSA